MTPLVRNCARHQANVTLAAISSAITGVEAGVMYLLKSCHVQDRSRMYTWGSVFYAIYFWVSFPVFFIMDEKPRKVWTVWEAARDSLASGMAVTMLLDFWRIAFAESKSQSLPWLS